MVASVFFNDPVQVYRASPDLRAARDWLVENTTPRDVVFASWDVANYLAGAIPGRTTGGHELITLDAARRRAMTAAAFASPDGQEETVRHGRPSYLVSAGPAEPILIAGAIPVFKRGAVSVVRVPRE